MGATGITLLGAGTVGSAVAAELLRAPGRLRARAGAPFELRHVVVRDLQRTRATPIPAALLTTDVAAALEDPTVGLVVEVMGGLDPAGSIIEQVLRSGRTVVTANKAVLAERGAQFAALARTTGAGLLFEAAVGAGMPIIGLLRHTLQGDVVQGIDAIINGTTNLMLGQMALGVSYADALADAQQAGYAEADPGADVEGHDAVAKLCLLCWLAFGALPQPSTVRRRGMVDVDPAEFHTAAGLGCSLKLVARAQWVEGALGLSVTPCYVERAHPLAAVEGVDNAVLLRCELAGPVLVRGAGAGGNATAGAVLGDIVEAVRAAAAGLPCWSPPPPRPLPLLDDEQTEEAAVIRVLRASAETGAQVAQMLEDRGVRVREVVSEAAHEVVVTRPASRAALERAVETLESLPWLERVAGARPLIPAP